MGFVTKQATALGSKLLGEEEEEQFDIAGIIMTQVTKFVGGTIKPMIGKMTAKLPSALSFAKAPLNTELCALIDQVVAQIGKGPSTWNSAGLKAIAQIVIKGVVKLGLKLKAASPVGWEESYERYKMESRVGEPKKGRKLLTYAKKNQLDVEWAQGSLGARLGETGMPQVGGAHGKKVGRLGDTAQSGYGGGKKGKKGGGMFGKLAGMAKKAVGAAGGGGMLMKLLNPLLKKLPADFQPLVKEVIAALLKGDKKAVIAAVKKGVIGIAKKKVMVWIDPIIKKLPADFQPMIKAVLPLLIAGNVNGAVGALKAEIIKYGVKKIKGLIGKVIVPKLPSFAQAPVKNFVDGMIDKQVANHARRELGSAAALKLAHEIGAEEVLPLNMANVLIQKGATFIGGVLPGLVDKMTAPLKGAGPLAAAEKPLNTELKAMTKKVVAVLAQGPTMWGEKGKAEITKIVTASAIKLAGELKSVAAGLVRL